MEPVSKKMEQSSGSGLLQVSLTHSGCAGSFTVIHKKLSLWSLFVLGIPHASFGVVVVKKVPQTESLHLQTILQDPARGNRDGKTNAGFTQNASLEKRQYLHWVERQHFLTSASLIILKCLDKEQMLSNVRKRNRHPVILCCSWMQSSRYGNLLLA